MKNQYGSNQTHSYVVGFNPEYEAYCNNPRLFSRYSPHPKKYWVGITLLGSDMGYDTHTKSNCLNTVVNLFEDMTS